MGAKQSKRSVDISGKEAEGGEVAAAGAGGEGRLESIADADTLKPQLNGDAYIQPIDEEEKTDKEKQLDSGTPENEKDATTEKEANVEVKEGDKEAAPVINGDAEAKPEEASEAAPTPEQEGKKPKKEKVKKKWSLRSISFSRKDKPKQEKKQKEEEPKTNGDADKLPEEAAEATPETVESKPTEEAKPEAVKEDKTPETPVTEPMTNGSSTPETPKAEAPAAAAPPTEPEQLPLNGLSIQDTTEVPEAAEPVVESKPAAPAPAAEAPAPADIADKTEVCVEPAPLVESAPPPLPANPPPSSVASFAASTMAPELDAPAPPPAAVPAPAPAPPAPADTIEPPLATDERETEASSVVDTAAPVLAAIENVPTEVTDSEQIPEDALSETPIVPVIEEIAASPIVPVIVELAASPIVPEIEERAASPIVPEIEERAASIVSEIEKQAETIVQEIEKRAETIVPEIEKLADIIVPEAIIKPAEAPKCEAAEKKDSIAEPVAQTIDSVESTPRQGPMGDSAENGVAEDNTNENAEITENVVVTSIHIPETNGIAKVNGNADETEQENLKNKTKDSVEAPECNGNGILPPPPAIVKQLPAAPAEDCSPSPPPPPPPADDFPAPPPPADSPTDSPIDTPQDLPIIDKIADLIPEIPDLPSDTVVIAETASDVAVAN